MTLGTAGHIDHGKTALVEALTGKNTDRLAEERRRGISIELGFAGLALPGGRHLSVIDVPGHERLVRTMVAGATGIDLFLLVIAADDGVMPQTREHVRVLRALGVDLGVIALTKIDLAAAEARNVAAAEARELLPGVPLVEVSAHTGEGLDQLREALGEVAERAAGPASGRDEEDRPAILHVDRVFTLKGIGTVVTGTLRSGTVGRGDRMEVLSRGIEARVRSVEVHDRPLERAWAGQRVAVSLTGVRRSELARGDVLASEGCGLAPTYRIDVDLELEGAERLDDGERIQVHHGTRDVPARVAALSDDGLAQLRLEGPLVPRQGDRFVVRRIAPPDTLGGGVILDPAPRRHGPGPAAERLRRIRAGEPVESAPVPPPRPAAPSREPRPLDRTAVLALALLDRDGLEPRAPQAIADALRIDRLAALAALDSLVEHGRATRLKADVYYSAPQLQRVLARIVDLAGERGQITLAELRDALGTSRKYAQALLEHLDATKVTMRRGDAHELRRSAAARG